MMTFKRILVPTDFSGSAERALGIGVDLAKTYGAQLTLLHVWSIPSAAYADTMSWPVADVEAAARATLDALAAHVAKLHAATDAVLRMGSEWRAILDVVSECGIELVVMGTHGRRGVPRILLGSVAEKIVRLSPVPVLTVREPESRP